MCVCVCAVGTYRRYVYTYHTNDRNYNVMLPTICIEIDKLKEEEKKTIKISTDSVFSIYKKNIKKFCWS